MDKAYQVLHKTFGLKSFRLSQEAVIRRLLEEGENALVLYPTAGGKSLTYQVSALCLEGLTLVISPLVSLMKDQVDDLVRKGVNAANLDCTQTVDHISWIREQVLSGSLKILYVAPERLNNETFINMMRQVKISLLAVDESHCISQWGQSFRPDYLKIALFAEDMDVGRVLCLTATATEQAVEDTCSRFRISPEGVFRTPMYRPNLALQVEIVDGFEDKISRLVPLLKARTGPAIVYVTLKRHTEELASRLKDYGLDAMVYHAGLPNEERAKKQTQFMESDKGIVCATIAFGMGINKANIRQVIHFSMPKSLENYSQEVGRAGRDGLPSQCVMFLCADDIPTLEGFARGDTCNKKDIQRWIHEVVKKLPSEDGTVQFNLYEQSRLFDIRYNVLNLCYAQLELESDHLKAVTPFYSVFNFKPRSDDGWSKVENENTPVARTIQNNWEEKGTSGYWIDVVKVAKTPGVDRDALARKISDWELSGYITVKASQVRARFLLNPENPLPEREDVESITALVDEMHARMVEREHEAVSRIQQVIDFATSNTCLSQALCKYFGDVDGVPDGRCGQCTSCKNGFKLEFNPTAQAIPDPKKIRAILDACPVRDDPRLLARMAFGITSPRLTAGKWSTSHHLFESMVEYDFNALVAAFDVECKKVGYKDVDQPTHKTVPASPAKKRAQTTNHGGRGYFSKRARYN